MSGAEVENDRRQRESCVLMKAKPPTLTLAGWEHIASAANNVRLPTKRVATEPQQADHGPPGPRHMGNPGLYISRSPSKGSRNACYHLERDDGGDHLAGLSRWTLRPSG